MRCPPAPGLLPRAEKQLRARPRAPREQVAASQRERLQGAMIEAVAQHGYEGASVDAIVALAGVSTKALYRRFGSKLSCFLATCELLLEAGTRRLGERCSQARRDGAELPSALQLTLGELLTLTCERPDAARLALWELLLVGEAALPALIEGEERIAKLLADALAGAVPCDGTDRDRVKGHGGGDHAPLDAPDTASSALAVAVTHGIWHVVRNRIVDGRQQDLLSLAVPLGDWTLSYRDPGLARLGGQPAPSRERRRLVVGEGEQRNVSAPRSRAAAEPFRDPVDGSDEWRRLLRATAQIAAAEGYSALSMPAIARRAEVPLERALDAFPDPQQCFLQTLRMLSASLLADALREAQHAPSWPAGACAFVEALLARVAADATLARVCFVEVFAAGEAAARQRQALLARFAELLIRRAPARLRPSPLVAEAIAGALWGVLHHDVVRGDAQRLPQREGEIAYLLLAPLLGAKQAVEAIRAR